MPWTADDAAHHSRAANTDHRRRTWAKVANRVLEEHGDEGRAVRAANAAVNRSYRSYPRHSASADTKE